MKIGIIGAGHIGGTLAEKFAAAGHIVGLANAHGPDSLVERVARLGANACPMTVDEVEGFGDLIVVSIPLGRHRELPSAGTSGKVLIDTMNYYPQRDGHIRELDDGSSTSSEIVARHFAGARVVKAFNTVRWDHLRDESHEAGDPERLAVPLAGDDREARSVVAELVDQIGFDPVDVGGLAFGGRRMQPGSPVYAAHIGAAEVKKRLAA